MDYLMLHQCEFNRTVQIFDNVTVRHNVYNLTADTTYNISLTVVSPCAEDATPVFKIVNTKIAVPGQVRDLKKSNDTCFSWKPPSAHPGQGLNYTVVLVDLVYHKPIGRKVVVRPEICFNSRVYGFWEYRVSVTAMTKAGPGPNKTLDYISQKQRPGDAITYAYHAEGGCPRGPKRKISYEKMELFLNIEPELRGRGLVGVSLQIREFPGSENVKLVTRFLTWKIRKSTDEEYRRFGGPIVNPFTIDVTPGSQYMFQWAVIDEEGKTFYVAVLNCSAPVAALPEWNGVYKFLSQEGRILKVNFSNTQFFTDRTNGKGTQSGLIISTVDISGMNQTDLLEKEWKDCEKHDVVTYRVGAEDLHNNVFLLGKDKNCKGFKRRFCNGYLCPDRQYYFKGFVCYRDICKFGPVFSRKPESSNTATTIAMLCIFGIATTAICAFLWIYVYRYYRKSAVLQVNNHKHESVLLTEYPIALKDMEQVVTSSDDKRLFPSQFKMLTQASRLYKTHEAVREENKHKNRWINILPFDHSRVQLKVVGDDRTSDYINANFLPGYNGDDEYIATQGPLCNTTNDFWRMVWEYDVPVIVMVTQLKEYTSSSVREKCDQYWPMEIRQPKQYGNLLVENISSVTLDTYNLTTFELRSEGGDEVKTVKHFHFLNWKDFGADVAIPDLLNFVRTVRAHIDTTSPIIVHCSAGVGRSGTFICVDYLMQFIENHSLQEKVDIFAFVMKLRQRRALMVQTESQFVFIHQCALEMVKQKQAAQEESNTSNTEREQEKTDTANTLAEEKTNTAHNVEQEKTDTAYNVSEEKTDTSNTVAQEKIDNANNVTQEKNDGTNTVAQDTLNTEAQEKNDNANNFAQEKNDTTSIVAEEKTDTSNTEAQEKTDNANNVTEEENDSTNILAQEKNDLSNMEAQEKTDNANNVAQEGNDITNTVAEEKTDTSSTEAQEKTDNANNVTEEENDSTNTVAQEKTDTPNTVAEEETNTTMTDFIEDISTVPKEIHNSMVKEKGDTDCMEKDPNTATYELDSFTEDVRSSPSALLQNSEL